MDAMHVAAAIIERDGRVFCAHRSASETGGAGWEFPGGKVEAGEEPVETLRRELSEELGVRLTTAWLLDTIEHDYPTFRLSMDCFICSMVPGSEIALVEHDEGRWLSRDELMEPDWLEADRKVARMLGVFWDQIFASHHL